MTVKDYVIMCARVYFGIGFVRHFLSVILDLEELHLLKSTGLGSTAAGLTVGLAAT